MSHKASISNTYSCRSILDPKTEVGWGGEVSREVETLGQCSKYRWHNLHPISIK